MLLIFSSLKALFWALQIIHNQMLSMFNCLWLMILIGL